MNLFFNPIKYLIIRRRANNFRKAMTNVIQSLHPDADFRIDTKIDGDDVEYHMDSEDKNAIACFILIQESLGIVSPDTEEEENGHDENLFNGSGRIED